MRHQIYKVAILSILLGGIVGNFAISDWINCYMLTVVLFTYILSKIDKGDS